MVWLLPKSTQMHGGPISIILIAIAHSLPRVPGRVSNREPALRQAGALSLSYGHAKTCISAYHGDKGQRAALQPEI